MKILQIIVLILAFAGFAKADVCSLYSFDLRHIVTSMGWVVTSERGGGHNAHSRHYRWKAIDVSVRNKSDFDIAVLFTVLENQGYIVRDERKRPKNQKVWKGAHIHIGIPECK